MDGYDKNGIITQEKWIASFQEALNADHDEGEIRRKVNNLQASELILKTSLLINHLMEEHKFVYFDNVRLKTKET